MDTDFINLDFQALLELFDTMLLAIMEFVRFVVL